MTRLLVAVALLLLGVFVWMWHPAAALLAGLAFLWLAATRSANQRRGDGR